MCGIRVHLHNEVFMSKALFSGSIAIAEESRDKTPYTGFLSGLFENETRWHLFFNHALPNFSTEETRFIEALHAVLKKNVDPEAIDASGEMPDTVIDALRLIGAFGIKVAKEYGGHGLSQTAYQKAAILSGSWCAATTVLISAHNSIGIPEPLKLFGTAAQKKEFLTRVAKGEISAFALTEKNVGCGISEIETYAQRIYKKGHRIGYSLMGEKCFITNATKKDDEFLASLLVVIARIVDSPQEISDPKAQRLYGAFIIDTANAGCSIKKLSFEGVRGIANGMPKFENVFVPTENRLGSENDGLRIALSTLTVGRLTLPAACLGGMRQCVWLSRSWAKKRVQWNKPVGEHTLVGEKIVRMAARSFALEAIMAACGIWADQKLDVRLESAASKILGSEWHWNAVHDAFQIRGGRAFADQKSQAMIDGSSVPLAQMLRDARINLIWEGTSEILRVWLGREGMDTYKKLGERIKTGTRIQKFAGLGMFVKRYIDSMLPRYLNLQTHKGTPFYDEMAFVETATRDLAHTAMRVIVRHQEKLQVKQIVIKELVDFSLWLFAISSLAWYASLPEIQKRPLSHELAKFFFQEARGAMYPPHSLAKRTLKSTKDSDIYEVAKQILDDKADWLEEGILKIPV